MKLKYDPTVDALYITLGKGTYKRTKKITDSLMADIARDGSIMGIEILDATENIKDFDPRQKSILVSS